MNVQTQHWAISVTRKWSFS